MASAQSFGAALISGVDYTELAWIVHNDVKASPTAATKFDNEVSRRKWFVSVANNLASDTLTGISNLWKRVADYKSFLGELVTNVLAAPDYVMSNTEEFCKVQVTILYIVVGMQESAAKDVD